MRHVRGLTAVLLAWGALFLCVPALAEDVEEASRRYEEGDAGAPRAAARAGGGGCGGLPRHRGAGGTGSQSCGDEGRWGRCACSGDTGCFGEPPLASRQDGVCARTRRVCDEASGLWQESELAALSVAGYEAVERSCDGQDNDCDGATDEGCDDDADGWCDATMRRAGAPSSCPSGADDCDDLHPQVRPDALELACDGRDNDCDGRTDEFSDCDGDGVPEDGDGSGVAGDAPCAHRISEGCDDNCPRWGNPEQRDADGDGVGDACACAGQPCPFLARFEMTCAAGGRCAYRDPHATDCEEAWGFPRDDPACWDVRVWVPPSSFPMGAPATGGGAAPREVSFASGYWIDRFEVTAAAVAAVLDARGGNDCGPAPCLGDGEDLPVGWIEDAARIRSVCQREPGGAADASCAAHPATGLSWYGARAVCEARGGRLCSEGEWERAAKGTSQRAYPWGEEGPAGGERASCAEADCADGFARAAPVGSFPAGAAPTGCEDMAGNAAEWVEDDDRDADERPPADGSPWIEPGSTARVARGGSYLDGAAQIGVTARAPLAAEVPLGGVGVRCCWGRR